jgi:hypothetical protein
MSRALRAVHELFVAGGVDVSTLDSTTVRPVVAKSWQRTGMGVLTCADVRR